MPLTPGLRIGPYEITAPIGDGRKRKRPQLEAVRKAANAGGEAN